jgi:hypothetical protein
LDSHAAKALGKRQASGKKKHFSKMEIENSGGFSIFSFRISGFAGMAAPSDIGTWRRAWVFTLLPALRHARTSVSHRQFPIFEIGVEVIRGVSPAKGTAPALRLKSTQNGKPPWT